MVAILNFFEFSEKIEHTKMLISQIIITSFNKQLCFSVALEKQKMSIHSEDSTKANNYHPAKNIYTIVSSLQTLDTMCYHKS